MAAIHLNQSTKKAAKKAADRGTTDPTAGWTEAVGSTINGIMNAPILLIVGAVLLSVILLYLLYWLYKRSKGRGEVAESLPEWEGTDLDEIVGPAVKDMVREFGQPSGSVLRHNFRSLGVVRRHLKFEESDDMNKAIGGSIAQVDEEDLQPLVDRNIITKNQQEEYAAQDKFPLRVLEKVPSGFFNRLMWVLTDRLAGREVYTRYMVVPRDMLADNGADGSITVPDYVQWRPWAGLWVASTPEVFGALQAVVYKKLYEMALKDHENYHEKINKFSPAHTQEVELAKVEKEAEVREELERFLSKMNNP